jgi:hypothetical protein
MGQAIKEMGQAITRYGYEHPWINIVWGVLLILVAVLWYVSPREDGGRRPTDPRRQKELMKAVLTGVMGLFGVILGIVLYVTGAGPDIAAGEEAKKAAEGEKKKPGLRLPPPQPPPNTSRGGGEK